MLAHYERMPSQSMGRPVHLWRYGHGGRPVIALPTAGGYAHEWQHNGAIDALSDLLDEGRLCVYQPETNVAEVWTHAESPLAVRMARHRAYESFVVDELIPRIWRETGRDDIVVMGASVGALYAVNLALKYPEKVPRAVGLSGRYQARTFTDGVMTDEVYHSDPSSYVWNMHGEKLANVRRHTHITLVCGQGRFEERCLAETQQLAAALRHRGVPMWADVWGHDVAHEWAWWRRQIRFQLLHRLDRW
jgi:esterase/lipase superfamily enzyme